MLALQFNIYLPCFRGLIVKTDGSSAALILLYNLDMGMWDTDQVTVRWSTQSFNGPLYEELSCEVFYASNISIHMIISSIMLYTHRIYLGHCSQDRICYWQVGDAKEFKVATLQKIGMQQFKNLLFLFAS